MSNDLKHGDITEKIIGASMEVHSFLGNGFQEVIYQRALVHEFEKAGLSFQREIEQQIYYKDLEIDSPYNTYKYYGLPPGPISNPGKKSVLAAIYPAGTNYIYFVAKGDGRHTFSRTAAEHARAKAEFNKVRREVRRKERAQKLKREN